MAKTKQSAEPGSPSPYSELFLLILGSIVLAAIWYLLFSALTLVGFLSNYIGIIKVVQFYGTLLIFALYGAIVLREFNQLHKAAKARKANDRVAEEISRITGDGPGQNVADISAEQVASSLKDAQVSEAQIARLVEQRKQQLLVDDEYFREEVSSLIVEYLQPLPRNAKRLMNQFRVSLLVAHSRKLLTTDPKVSGKQIGKWLVLMERWPQLGRSLSADAEKMGLLEQQSARPAPPVSDPPQQDPFMESIRVLAPPYLGDEDLRKFIRSAPALAVVVPRLVHYGEGAAMPPGVARASS
jgi:hypothetical protein